MFCIQCRVEVFSTAANYCYSCGKELKEQKNEDKQSDKQQGDKQNGKPLSKLSYKDFRKRKLKLMIVIRNLSPNHAARPVNNPRSKKKKPYELEWCSGTKTIVYYPQNEALICH